MHEAFRPFLIAKKYGPQYGEKVDGGVSDGVFPEKLLETRTEKEGIVRTAWLMSPNEPPETLFKQFPGKKILRSGEKLKNQDPLGG